MIFKNKLSEIADNYDHFILDVWGVIHDGIHAYPGVVESLQDLKKSGKKVCFLSNAPRRASKVVEVLKGFGISENLYDFMMTSGEATYLFLEEHHSKRAGSTNSPYQYYYIGPKKDADLLNGLGYQSTEDAAEADFAVATGFDDGKYDIEEKMPQLKQARKYNLPLICVNPDLIVVRQSGEEILCAGVLALEYQKMGGEVDYFGKPYSLVYDQVFKLFSIKDKSKVLAVGDGIETDILGANNNNIDSALVAGGILAKQLEIKHGKLPSEVRMKQVCDEYEIYPKFVIGSI